jgi:hypothetical protein
MHPLYQLLAAQGPTDAVDVGAQVSQNGLYGIITVMGAVIVVLFGLLMKSYKDRNTDKDAMRDGFDAAMKEKSTAIAAEFAEVRAQNVNMIERTITAVLDLTHAVNRLSERIDNKLNR